MENIETLEERAVEAAMILDWKKAIKFNEAIIHLDKDNLSAYLRLGFSYLKQQVYKKAKYYYNKALKIQPKNRVALENIDKINILINLPKRKEEIEMEAYNPSLFLEVPGMTKSVSLVNLGQKKDIAGLGLGQRVLFKQKNRKVEVRKGDDTYIGTLPDDLSKRLNYFLKAKSRYSCFIKEVEVGKVIVFIKEEKKGTSVSHYLSFPNNISLNLNKLGEEAEHQSTTEAEEEGDDDKDEIQKLAEVLTDQEEEKLIDENLHQEEDESEE